MERSPLAPAAFPELPAIAGVTLRVARAQYKAWDRCDLTYVELAEGTAVAGVFTRNVCCSSEVELCRANVKDQGRPRPRAGGQCRQFQRLHRLSRARGGGSRSWRRSRASGLPARRSVRLVHRRDRRAAAQGQGARRAWRPRSPPRPVRGKRPRAPSAPPTPSPRARPAVRDDRRHEASRSPRSSRAAA
jgi:hypothetical protein